MNIKLLELHFSQLSKAWSRSKFNNYSDTRKQAYKNELASLFDKLKEDDFSTLSSAQIQQRASLIDFFFKSLEFLDSSTLTLFPFEIVECLEVALKEWLDQSKEFIIVTSLINDPDGFSFDSTLAVSEEIYETLKIIYNIEFSRRLIQINLPRFFVKDYLSNVVLYHELGHFVDVSYNISHAVHNELCQNYFGNRLSPSDKNDVEYFFEGITHLTLSYQNKRMPYTIFFYIREYFSDLFASQYIGDCSNIYLNYITKGQTFFAEQHPATTHRIAFVDKFLNNDTGSYTLNLIKEATRKITGREFLLRYNCILTEDFINLVPSIIEEDKQLHYLFIKGWQTWLDDWKKISTRNNMQFNLTGEQVYTIINNLIEKSINSYIVTKSWKTANATTKGTD